jgi:hypothetical protein
VSGGNEEPDPFEGLVLDEEFVRAAATFEPPARTREALARHPVRELPRSWDPGRAKRASRRRDLTTLLIAIVLVAGGYVGYHALTSSGGEATAASATPRPSPTRELTLEDQVYLRGACYRWNQDVDHSTAVTVSCSAPHLFEAVKRVHLSGYDHKPFPSEAEWDVLGGRLCNGPVSAYLHAPLDPEGRYYSSLIQPVREGWEEGQRTVDCGVGVHLPAVYGTQHDDSVFDSSTGRADGAHQAFLYPIGTCIRFDSRQPGSLPCSAPHSDVVVGRVTLAPGGPHPSQAAFNRMVRPGCEAAATRYLRHPLGYPATLSVTWSSLSSPSWAAGTRDVDCYLTSWVNGQRTLMSGSRPA